MLSKLTGRDLMWSVMVLMVCVTALEGIALFMGHNGVMFMGAMATLGALIGVPTAIGSVSKIAERVINRRASK